MQPRNAIGLDVGERRIGVALASVDARLPSALKTIDRVQTPNAYEAIAKLVTDNNAATVVVGLPRGMDGQETAQTETARAFGRELQEHISIPIAMQDEAGTSLLAEEELRLRGKPYGKGDIDALAAVYILQDWLDNNVVEQAE